MSIKKNDRRVQKRGGVDTLKREEKVITGSRKWGEKQSLKNGGRGEIYVRKAKKQVVKKGEKRKRGQKCVKKAMRKVCKEGDEKRV